ncbi:MAG: hypothetical protein Tsb002_29850 [Wenzhouxiangellaceae bacterium]
MVSTITLALSDADPPGPVQVTVTVVVLLGDIVRLPEVPDTLTPLLPVQLVALVELQLSVVLWPMIMAVGLKLADTVGGVEESSTVKLAVSVPITRSPLIAPPQLTVAVRD